MWCPKGTEVLSLDRHYKKEFSVFTKRYDTEVIIDVRRADKCDVIA